MEDIKWKLIKGFDGMYDISEFGKIKSRFKGGRILKNYLSHNGYEFVRLYKNFKYKNYRVNRLVAEYFIPNPENKPQVNHKDGNKSNNHVSNLEWCTASENIRHALKNGLSKLVKPKRKLINCQVLMIRDYIKDGVLNQYEIAEMFDVDQSTISNIKTGKIFKRIKLKDQ